MTPKRNTCFVLMPFRIEFEEVYAQIKSAVAEIGFTCNRADSLFDNKPIMTNIISEIICSHFIIADLTDRNPNVFYEIGISHALRDAVNVLLIAQDMEHVPFDLRHLPVVLYKMDNLISLSVKLKKLILENKSYFEGEQALRNRYFHRVEHESELVEMIEYFKTTDSVIWELVLEANQIRDESIDAEQVLDHIYIFQAALALLIKTNKIRLFLNLYRVFLDTLLFFAGNKAVDMYIRDTLGERSLPFSVGESMLSGLLADLAMAAIQHPKYRRVCLQWMFDYLSRNKVAGVDLNRSKIESFIMNSRDPFVKDALIAALSDRNPVVREAMADFIGELRIHDGLPNLLSALQIEENPYTVRSIISAIGKVGTREVGQSILQWTESHAHWIKESNAFYIFKRVRAALELLDDDGSLGYISKLNEIYKNFMIKENDLINPGLRS